jgi:hypothetical protein
VSTKALLRRNWPSEPMTDVGQKRRLLGQCPCLPAGQLDPDERTRDDAGAIQNLVVCHGGMAAHGAGAYPASLAHVAEHRAQEAE